ncbi:MAG: hypothetical protein U0359_18175 [Byssovorax sp.]
MIAGRRRQSLLAALSCAGLAACSSSPPAPGPGSTSAPPGSGVPSLAPTGAATVAQSPPAIGPSALVDPNPLRLPPRKLALDPGKRVFTVPAAMLEGARAGSTFVLYAATVAGFEGDDLIIEGKGGPSYRIGAAYAIPVPDETKLKLGDVVLTEWGNGVMKHAVVTRFVKDRIGVRYTDMEARTPEALLLGGRPTAAVSGPSKAVRFVKQTEGLAPGNYAAQRVGDDLKHVLLVSPFTDGGRKRWLCLGFGGAAQVVDEGDLVPIPIRWSPKVGAAVWAEWAGTLRRGTVQGIDDPGLFTVKFERAGRPATVGFGQIMAPPADAPSSAQAP